MPHQTQTLFNIILSNIDHGMIVSDVNNIIQHVNPAFEKMTGHAANEVLGKDPEILVSGEDNTAIISTMRESLNAEGSWQGEIEVRHQNGDICLFHSFIRVSVEQAGGSCFYVTTMQDLTKGKGLDKNDESKGKCNTLTGLPDQYLYRDRLEQALIAAKGLKNR